MKTKEYYIRDVSKLNHPHTLYMISLMQAHDTLRSGMMWIDSSKNPNNLAKETEHLVAFLTTISWIYESINLLGKGRSRKNPPIHKDMLKDQPQLLEIWKEIKKKNSPRIIQIEKIRNRRIFHFDSEGPEKALKFIKQHELQSTPFVETIGIPTVNDTRYTFAYLSLGSAFCEDDLDLEKLADEMKLVLPVIPDILKLIQRLLYCIWENIGIELDLKDDQKEK